MFIPTFYVLVGAKTVGYCLFCDGCDFGLDATAALSEHYIL